MCPIKGHWDKQPLCQHAVLLFYTICSDPLSCCCCCCFVISYKYRKLICSPPTTEHQSYRQSQSTRSSPASGQLSLRSWLHERCKKKKNFSTCSVTVCVRVHLTLATNYVINQKQKFIYSNEINLCWKVSAAVAYPMQYWQWERNLIL